MLKVENLSVQLGGKPILENISFALKPHTLTAVLGRNGCGKSTLLSCISGQLRHTGRVLFGEDDLALMSPKERAKRIAVLPQVLTAPPIRAEELVMFGRNPYLDFGRRPSEEDREAVQSAMKTAGAEAYANRLVSSLSGGERQRVFFAMVLAQKTRVILLDEPTTYLDVEAQTAFLNCLSALRREQKKTLLVVMHDLTQAVQYADRILVVGGHRLVFDGTREECLDSHILEDTFAVARHTFTEDGKTYHYFTGR